MSQWLRSGVALALLPAAALAGCTEEEPSTGLPPGQLPSPTGATTGAAGTSAAPGDRVLASYLGYWDAVVAAHRAADPRSAGLARAAADPQLRKVRLTVERNRLQQISLRGEVTHEPTLRQVAGDTATVEDCYDISDWDPVNLRTGESVEVTEEGGTGRYRARYTLRRAGAGWLVTTEAPLGGC